MPGGFEDEMTTVRNRCVVTFGELLLRLDTQGPERLVQAESFLARYTGAEANVAVALSSLGIDTHAVSKVPAHEVGQACINALRRYGVNTDHIVRGGSRLGILYVEPGAGQRPAKVIYDREGSAFRELRVGEIDWPEALSGKDWLHLSGTAPAAGESMIGILVDALQAARAGGVRVSFDCNYRSTLWSLDAARAAFTTLLPLVDVFIGSRHDARQLFGIDGDARTCAEGLRDRFGFQGVALTERGISSAQTNVLSAYLQRGTDTYATRERTVEIVERIGGGDAFSAALIYGLLHGWALPKVAEFALAAYALKHSIAGDFNLVTVDEVERLASQDDAFRILR